MQREPVQQAGSETPATRTLLLPHRTHPADDAAVLEIVAGMPWQAAVRCAHVAGVRNDDGEIYRELFLCSEFELLLLTARMNAAGFTVDFATQRHGHGLHHCDRVFRKRVNGA